MKSTYNFPNKLPALRNKQGTVLVHIPDKTEIASMKTPINAISCCTYINTFIIPNIPSLIITPDITPEIFDGAAG